MMVGEARRQGRMSGYPATTIQIGIDVAELKERD